MLLLSHLKYIKIVLLLLLSQYLIVFWLMNICSSASFHPAFSHWLTFAEICIFNDLYNSIFLASLIFLWCQLWRSVLYGCCFVHSFCRGTASPHRLGGRQSRCTFTQAMWSSHGGEMSFGAAGEDVVPPPSAFFQWNLWIYLWFCQVCGRERFNRCVLPVWTLLSLKYPDKRIHHMVHNYLIFKTAG